MRKQKGFTLVELIAVVVVLGIIALIAVPAVSNYMYKADDEYYVAVSNSVLASGRDYFSDYHTLLPKNDNDTTSVELEELVEDDYIEKIVNNDGEECTGTVYVTRKGNRDYTYCVVIYCGEEKKLRRNTCGNGDEVPEVKDREYKILKQVSLRIPQCSTYEELINGIPSTQYVGAEAKYKYNNKLIGLLADKNENVLQNNGRNIIIYPDESDLNLKALGDYSLTYEYNGADNQVTKVTVEDIEGPNRDRLSISFKNADGSPYSCEDESQCTWTNQNITITFDGYDLTTKNSCAAEGSGISQFYYKLEGDSNYRKIQAYRVGKGHYVGKVTLTENEYKGVIYYNAVDKKGTIAGADKTKYLMIDTIVPSVSIEAKKKDSGTVMGTGVWSSEYLNFKLDKVTSGISGYTIYHCMDTKNTCDPNTTAASGSNITNYNSTLGVFYVRYKIVSGAKSSSPIGSYNAKVDITAPVAKSSSYSAGNPGTWTASCTDSESGVVNSNPSINIGSTGNHSITCKNNAGITANVSHSFGSSNCATGENTCVAGYTTEWSNCATGNPNDTCVQKKDIYCTNCVVDPYTCKSMCQSSLGSDWYDSNLKQKGNDGQCQCTREYSCNTCKGGNVQGPWSDCATGHNTCAFGYTW